ncbi:MAG: ABC transporter substrate-binding protein [Vicingaceae bacterium]
MRKLFFSLFVSFAILFTSCGGNENNGEENTIKNIDTAITNLTCLDFAIDEKHYALDVINVTDEISFHVASQIFEPLLRFNEKDLELTGLIADSWTISEDNLVYTFKLKKGIYFQNNNCFNEGKGRELNAADVVYTFKRIYQEKTSYAFSIFNNVLKGSENYVGGDISGLKAIDDYTVEFTLNRPSANFINLLATINAAIVAKEAIAKNAVVGSGPFTYLKENDTEKGIKLIKNNNYHVFDKGGVRLPYIDAVAFNYIPNQEQLNLFMENELDIIREVPPEVVKKLLETKIADFQSSPSKYVLGRLPEVTTSYLSLNTAIAPFDNKKIRQALGMAINKVKIVNDVLKGEAYSPGVNGIVPSAINNYDFTSVIGLDYNVKKAKQLLKEAGFPNGKDFPTLTFATGKSNLNVRVALEIQKQLLTNLNVNVEISSYTTKERTKLNSNSSLNMSLSGWLGDFPGPTSFLAMFHGVDVPKDHTTISYPNETRYVNAKFDKLYEKALTTIDPKKRYEICLEADQIIAQDVPAIPLWYHENYQLVQSNVTGYQQNSMNIQYLIRVKINEPIKTSK